MKFDKEAVVGIMDSAAAATDPSYKRAARKKKKKVKKLPKARSISEVLADKKAKRKKYSPSGGAF